MKKYLLILFGALTFAGITKVVAQPTISIDPEFQLINAGEQATIDFVVDDFTDIQAMTFSVRWDPETMTIASPADIFNPNPLMTNLVLANDVTYDNDEGWLVFMWEVMEPLDCNSTLDVTLNDEESLFSVNFTGITGYTDVTIGDDPEPQYVTRTNSCPQDITMNSDDGFVAVNNLPITLDVPFINANEGETICMDFTVQDFVDIISFQYTVGWDPTVLSFNSVTCQNLPNCTASNFNPFPADGFMTVSWFNTPDGVTLPDGSGIMQICFDVIGGCSETTAVEIIDDPTPIEITNASDPGTDIGFLAGEGQVSINCFNPDGLTVNVESAMVSPGENFCLDLTVEDFDDLVGFDFSINWNPNLIDFTSLTNVNNNLFFFNNGNFDQGMVNDGVLTVSWNDPSCFGDDLSDGEVLATLCFETIGGCLNSPVSITSNPEPIQVLDECGGDDIGINTFNGLVEIICPDGIIVSAPAINADPGDQVCIPVTVQNFEDIEEFAFTIEWETSVLQYESTGNYGLPNFSAANFDDSFAAFGAMCVDWTDLSGTGISVNDGDAIFEVCFNVVGDPFECSPINFSDFPCGVNVVSTQSSGVNIGLTSQVGEVCVNNPFNFQVNISDDNGVVGEEVCVDVSVVNFVSLEELDFSLNWNPSQLEFTELQNPFNLPNFTTASYDDSNAGVGSISVDWNSLTINGESVPNDEVIFTLCFELIGDEGNCEAITVTNNPQPINVVPANAGGINIGLISDEGEICIIESLQVSASITGVDCPSDNTGMIDLTVTGGSGNYTFLWTGPGITGGTETDEDQTGLTNTTYTVTVTDADNPNIIVEQMYDVPLSGFAPVADAGEDVSLPCGSSLLTLDGTGSSQGVGEYDYLWTGLGGGSVQPGTETTLMPTIFGPGDYQLEVEDLTTGCTVYDTITVSAAIVPGLEISAQDSIDCQTDTVSLLSDGSSVGPDFDYEWTTATGSIVPGTETESTALVTGEGWYVLTITDLNNDCSSVDSVFVQVDTITPMAVAGDDQNIDCVTNTVMLDGSASSAGPGISYTWTDPMGGLAGTTPMINASEIGNYVLTVTNSGNFCSATDTVAVIGDLALPTADAGADQFITCLVDTVTLDGTGSSSGNPGDFTYLWQAISGNIIGAVDGTTIQSDQAGEYQLTVTDESNGCEAVSTVFVIEDIAEPVAEAGMIDTIDCDVPQIQLDGAGSSAGTPGEFTYQWDGPGLVSGATTLSPEVNAAGTYTITVTDSFNGCTTVDSVSIVNLQDNVVATIALPDTITCLQSCVILDATGTSVGPDISYTWSGPFCIDQTDPLMAEVCCAGTFTLQVSDANTGCTASTSVTVVADEEEPVAVTNNEIYTCLDDCITLDAAGTSEGPEYTYAWSTIPAGNGIINSGGNTLLPEVCGPGVYGLLVTDTTNGCFVTATATVTADTTAPTAVISGDVLLTCNTPEVTLDGSNSGPDVTSFQWYFDGMAVVGGTTDMLDVSEPGSYVLEVTGTNGCVGADTTDLNQADPPIADAVEESELGCSDESVTIVNNSPTGPDLTYNWTALTGTLDPATVDQEEAAATSIGTFVLTITDETTGCSASDTVEVVSGLGNLPTADFDFEQEPCTNEATLFAEIGEGVSGQWTINTSGSFLDVTDPNTIVTDLAPGLNIVTWTLSAADCPDYSTFSDTIFVEAFPIANNDSGEMGEDDTSVEISLLDNDFLNDASGDNLFITQPPLAGTLSGPENGVVTYTPPANFGGEVEFFYALCSDVCPDLCDTALVLINVNRDSDFTDVPNGITPNGDGLNDVLIFDILLFNPDDYPNNEIIIFNRWGDIVFQASPYNNDWGGTNMSGQDLPQGTYYYTLRLDVGESEIIRGFVTIVR